MDELDGPRMMDELDTLRADLRRVVAASERAERTVAELATVIDTLLQILRLRGALGDGHLRMLDRLRGEVRRVTEPALKLNPSTLDKYGQASVEIDCAARIHLCHGRCCAYSIELSEQDLVEGKLAWRIREPYYLPQTDDGYCVYQDRDDGGCGAYAHRPSPCRTYDCREDARIWIDFEQRLPAPLTPGLVPIRRKPPAQP